MTTDQTADFDGCNRRCRLAGAHTLAWGECEHAPKPEPTVSLSRVYTDTDGYPSIGFDAYTVPELARLIEPALGDPLKAAAAARRIVHRHDELPAAVPVPPPADRAALRAAVTAAVDRAFDAWKQGLGTTRPQDAIVDEVMAAVLPEPTDRAAVLREAADAVFAMDYDELVGEEGDENLGSMREAWDLGTIHATELLRRVAAEEQPAETQAAPPGPGTPRCATCTHQKSDHDGRADHRARFSPLVAGEPWCHACEAPCDYAERPAVAEQPDTQTREALCRCGHGRDRHAPDVYGTGTCADCPGDEERSWRHPFTPAP